MFRASVPSTIVQNCGQKCRDVTCFFNYQVQVAIIWKSKVRMRSNLCVWIPVLPSFQLIVKLTYLFVKRLITIQVNFVIQSIVLPSILDDCSKMQYALLKR